MVNLRSRNRSRRSGINFFSADGNSFTDLAKSLRKKFGKSDGKRRRRKRSKVSKSLKSKGKRRSRRSRRRR